MANKETIHVLGVDKVCGGKVLYFEETKTIRCDRCGWNVPNPTGVDLMYYSMTDGWIERIEK